MKKTSWKGLIILWILTALIGSVTGIALCDLSSCGSPERMGGIFIETGAVVSTLGWFYFRSKEKEENK